MAIIGKKKMDVAKIVAGIVEFRVSQAMFISKTTTTVEFFHEQIGSIVWGTLRSS